MFQKSTGENVLDSARYSQPEFIWGARDRRPPGGRTPGTGEFEPEAAEAAASPFSGLVTVTVVVVGGHLKASSDFLILPELGGLAEWMVSSLSSTQPPPEAEAAGSFMSTLKVLWSDLFCSRLRCEVGAPEVSEPEVSWFGFRHWMGLLVLLYLSFFLLPELWREMLSELPSPMVRVVASESSEVLEAWGPTDFRMIPAAEAEGAVPSLSPESSSLNVDWPLSLPDVCKKEKQKNNPFVKRFGWPFSRRDSEAPHYFMGHISKASRCFSL